MVNQYNSVEITEEEKASLSEPEEATEPLKTEESVKPSDEVQEAETTEPEGVLDEKTPEDDSIDLDEYDIEINGETYSAESIQKWMEDSSNKESWQKSNTQKAQELSKWNKLIDKVSDDEKFREYLGDFFYDNPEELAKLNLDGKATVVESEEEEIPAQAEPEADPNNDRIDQLDDKITELESDKIVESLEQDFDAIIKDNQDYFKTPEEELNFLEFCVDNKVSDLTSGFMLYTWDDLVEQVDHLEKLQENKERNQGVVVNTREAGGPEQNAPRSYTNYKDMSVKDPEISKYFDNK